MRPEDTSGRDSMIHLLGAMSDGPSGYIEGMEADGQRQLVASESLPTDTYGADADFLGLGFTLGEPDPRDPMFRPATLPEGWKRQRSDHSMWSHIVDPQGRRRVAIFYKAAFYDRSAHMRLETVYGYVSGLLYDGGQPILDDTWCTAEAVRAALASRRKEIQERIDLYSTRLDDPSVSWAAEDLASARTEMAKVDAFEATLGDAR